MATETTRIEGIFTLDNSQYKKGMAEVVKDAGQRAKQLEQAFKPPTNVLPQWEKFGKQLAKATQMPVSYGQQLNSVPFYKKNRGTSVPGLSAEELGQARAAVMRSSAIAQQNYNRNLALQKEAAEKSTALAKQTAERREAIRARVGAFGKQVQGAIGIGDTGLLQGISGFVTGFAGMLKDSIVGAVTGGLKLGFAGATGLVAVGALGLGAAISQASNAEVQRQQMGVLLQDPKKGVALAKEVQHLAASTALTQAGAQSSTVNLLSQGIDGKDVIKTLKMLGDTALGDEDKLQRLSVAYGQVSNMGKLRQSELNQFINAGVNPLQQMVKDTGRTMQDLKDSMENGGITFGDVAIAFEHMTTKGGMFFGALDGYSKTFKGAVEQSLGSLQQFAVGLGTPIINALKEQINSLSGMFGGDLEGAGTGIGESIVAGATQFVAKIKEGWDWLKAEVQAGTLGDSLGQSIMDAGRYLTGVTAEFSDKLANIPGAIASDSKGAITDIFHAIDAGLPSIVGGLTQIIVGVVNTAYLQLMNALEASYTAFTRKFGWINVALAASTGGDVIGAAKDSTKSADYFDVLKEVSGRNAGLTKAMGTDAIHDGINNVGYGLTVTTAQTAQAIGTALTPQLASMMAKIDPTTEISKSTNGFVLSMAKSEKEISKSAEGFVLSMDAAGSAVEIGPIASTTNSATEAAKQVAGLVTGSSGAAGVSLTASGKRIMGGHGPSSVSGVTPTGAAGKGVVDYGEISKMAATLGLTPAETQKFTNSNYEALKGTKVDLNEAARYAQSIGNDSGGSLSFIQGELQKAQAANSKKVAGSTGEVSGDGGGDVNFAAGKMDYDGIANYAARFGLNKWDAQKMVDKDREAFSGQKSFDAIVSKLSEAVTALTNIQLKLTEVVST